MLRVWRLGLRVRGLEVWTLGLRVCSCEQESRSMLRRRPPRNGLESFPVFAAGILGATLMGVDKATVGKLASFHLVCRTAFNVLYMGFNTPGPALGRTLAWFLSLFSSCQLIALAASK